MNNISIINFDLIWNPKSHQIINGKKRDTMVLHRTVDFVFTYSKLAQAAAEKNG